MVCSCVRVEGVITFYSSAIQAGQQSNLRLRKIYSQRSSALFPRLICLDWFSSGCVFRAGIIAAAGRNQTLAYNYFIS